MLRLLESLFGSLRFDSKIYPGSKATLRSQWKAIMRQLGVPFRKVDRGVTPGVLRGSGATYLYLETEDLSRVAWRGRWARQKNVEFYLQEVAAQVIWQRLPEPCRRKIIALRPLAAKLVQLHTDQRFRETS